jgi:NAD(P)-dependent dehydrogenase (short-subunit alcohol dehydrogenase family)
MKKDERPAHTDTDRPCLERRDFLGRSALASLAASGSAFLSTGFGSGRAQAAEHHGHSADLTAKAPLRDIAGKVAFITGGSSGIGLGMARAFSAAGMKVVFTYLRPEHRDEALALFKPDNPGVHAIRLDVVDRDAIARAADEVEQTFGKVHLLCCNAGIGLRTPISNATFKDWDWAMGVNVGGVFNTIHAFLPRIRAHREGGHVMATSSSGGLLAGGKVGIYCTTKFAVMGMMESLREELEGENIGVSVFCPGLVKSNIVHSDRNRPAELANDAAKTPVEPPSPAMENAAKMWMAVAMDPLEAGEKVLQGIRQNDLFILTHQEFEEPVRGRCDALLASFPVKKAPADRVAVVKTYTPDIYVLERDRKLRQRKSKKAG